MFWLVCYLQAPRFASSTFSESRFPVSLQKLPPDFELIKGHNLIGAVRKDVSSCLETTGLFDADATSIEKMEGIMKLGGRGTVYSVPLPSSGRRIVVRCSRRGGFGGALLKDKYWGSRRPFRELAVTEKMRKAGIPVPEMLAVIARRALGPFFTTVIVTRLIENAVNLADFLQECGTDRGCIGRKKAVIDATACLVRRMHDAGFLHADLQAKNILVQQREESNEIFVVDLDGARHLCSLGNKPREKNLFRLNRSIAKLGLSNVTRADRLRFLRSYFADDPLGDDAEGFLIKRCDRHQRRHQRFWRQEGD